MATEKIIGDWKKNKFKPIYWLEGEESYFIDQVVEYAEKNLLTEAEAGFNLTIFYGKDADWAAVVNACRRYPMFADKQVVILKEAQQMRDIEKLEGYIENPLHSTIFIVSHKEKKVDGRGKLAKSLKKNAEILSTKKLYDNQLVPFTAELVQSKNLSISTKALHMLVEHVGSDLSRIDNEIDKLIVNLSGRKNITEDDVEKYIGISKEYNVFELQSAIAIKDFAKCIRIIQYFESNPKAGPIQLILPSVFNLFSKAYILRANNITDENNALKILELKSTYQTKEPLIAARRFDMTAIERILLTLHHYNLRSVGIGSGTAGDAGLLKELVVKIMHAA
ncbi:MAG: DNA polymerase III subunit delta [Chitinophagaceae bacterium]|nr:DNA polymerase III subunit delta [Chitinophagaceae bacterium]